MLSTNAHLVTWVRPLSENTQKIFWNLLPGLASTSSYYPPSCPPPLVTLCLLTHPLDHFLLQRPPPLLTLCLLTHPLDHFLLQIPLPPYQDPYQHPHLFTPSAPPSIPPVWEHVIDVLMKLPSPTADGQTLRSLVTYHSLTSLEDFQMWGLDTPTIMLSLSVSPLGILPNPTL